jgi:predicted esterase
MRIAILALAVSFLAPHAHAQVDEIVTAKLDRYTIAALVTRQGEAKTFKHGIAIFPGQPGILKLREEKGQLEYDQRGNFLIRSRRHWLDDETLTAVLDAPSDQWATFTQGFRATPRYGADIAAILNEVSKRYGVGEWTLVGTSEGSISAFHAARMNPAIAKRVILTSSVFSATANGAGLTGANFGELSTPLLWVHHENDPCKYTQYRDARRYAEKSMSPLVTVRGGGPETGGACQARSHHGYVGVEREVVLAMRSWVTTGTVPADIGR